MRVRGGFGELEAVVMDRVWDRAEVCTVRDVFDELAADRVIAYTTVLSTMDNLHRKGVAGTRTGRQGLPLPSRDDPGRAFRQVDAQRL